MATWLNPFRSTAHLPSGSGSHPSTSLASAPDRRDTGPRRERRISPGVHTVDGPHAVGKHDPTEVAMGVSRWSCQSFTETRQQRAAGDELVRQSALDAPI